MSRGFSAAATLVLCTASLTSAFAKPPPRKQLLIWNGGTTREEAETLLKRDKVAFSALAEALDLTVSATMPFPQLIESSTLQGLKPGFFVISMGLCDARDAKKALAVLKLLRRQVYARPVVPKFDTLRGVCGTSLQWPDDSVAGSDEKWSAFVFTQNETAPGPLAEDENRVTGFRVLSVLMNEQHEVTTFNVVKSSSTSSQLDPPTIDAGKLQLEETYVEDPCTGYRSQKTKSIKKTVTLETKQGVTFEPVTSTQKDEGEIQCEADMG